MIYGIGTDICDIRRIAATFERRGLRFAERVLGEAELKIFHARRAREGARPELRWLIDRRVADGELEGFQFCLHRFQRRAGRP